MNETQTQRWRSRHPNYRFRNVQFNNNCATVSNADDIQAAAQSPFFGRDRDFWRDDVQPAAPSPSASSTPSGDAGSAGASTSASAADAGSKSDGSSNQKLDANDGANKGKGNGGKK